MIVPFGRGNDSDNSVARPTGQGGQRVKVEIRSCLLGAPIASVLVSLEGMARANVTPGQKHRAVLLVAGRVEYVAKVRRLSQTLLDSLDERGICLVAGAHR